MIFFLQKTNFGGGQFFFGFLTNTDPSMIFYYSHFSYQVQTVFVNILDIDTIQAEPWWKTFHQSAIIAVSSPHTHKSWELNKLQIMQETI